MRSLSTWLFIAVLGAGSLVAYEARADLGPPKTCNLDGKGCETCDFAAGKEDEACATEKKGRGLVMTCQSGGASNGKNYYCPAGTKETTTPKEDGGCNQAASSSSAASLVTVIAGLVAFAAMKRKRRA